jgi:hypothetical protein
MKEITNPGKKGNQEKAKQNKIHKKPTFCWRSRKALKLGDKWRVCPLASSIVKRRVLPTPWAVSRQAR